MRPEVDQLPGACKEWYAVQHFARLTSKEGPLACDVSGCAAGLPRRHQPRALAGSSELKNGWLFSYVMNNYWFTNYKADQGGQMAFSYSITTQAATDAQAARFGWQASKRRSGCMGHRRPRYMASFRRREASAASRPRA